MNRRRRAATAWILKSTACVRKLQVLGAKFRKSFGAQSSYSSLGQSVLSPEVTPQDAALIERVQSDWLRSEIPGHLSASSYVSLNIDGSQSSPNVTPANAVGLISDLEKEPPQFHAEPFG